MKKAISILFILLVLAGMGFLAFSSGTSYLAEQGVRDAGDAYLEALKTGDFATAFTLSDPTLQSQFGDAVGVQSTYAGRGFFPDEWSFHETSINGDMGTLQASVTITSGQRMGMILDLNKIEGDWLVSRVELIGS